MKAFKKVIFIFIVFILRKGSGQTWSCNDGSRIEESWKCDGDVDCLDGSDESLDNCPLRECVSGEFQCLSGACIPFGLVCNGEADCFISGADDDSDETFNCTLLQKNPDLCDQATEHHCENGLCIPISWVCNGMDECGDGSDEKNCTKRCSRGHVRCNSSQLCIDESWICDGVEDCGDAEDEKNCETDANAFHVLRYSQCEVDQFQCGGICVDVIKSCNGKIDCPEGEDEGAHCRLRNCRIRSDPVTWKSSQPLCDHGCRSTPHGPMCYCFQGYKLKQDGLRCKVEDGNVPKLLFATRDQIQSLTLQSSFPTEVILYKDHKNVDSIIPSFVFEAKTNTLIWIEKKSNNLQMMDANLHQSNIMQIEGVTQLSLDWLTSNLYFISTASQYESGIGLINLNKKNRIGKKDLIYLDLNVKQATALAVHPEKRKMIFIDQGKDQTSSRLLLANMDGRNATLLATRPHMISVTVDCVTDIIYWSEANEHKAKILMMKMDGSAERTLISSSNRDLIISHPISLTVFQDKLYFGDNVTREIWSLDSLSGKPSKFASSHSVPLYKSTQLNQLHSIHVHHPILQQRKHAQHACDYAHCSHACVLLPTGGSQCLCPKTMSLVKNRRCVPVNHKNNTKPISNQSPSVETITNTIDSTETTNADALLLTSTKSFAQSVKWSQILTTTAPSSSLPLRKTEASNANLASKYRAATNVISSSSTLTSALDSKMKTWKVVVVVLTLGAVVLLCGFFLRKCFRKPKKYLAFVRGCSKKSIYRFPSKIGVVTDKDHTCSPIYIAGDEVEEDHSGTSNTNIPDERVCLQLPDNVDSRVFRSSSSLSSGTSPGCYSYTILKESVDVASQDNHLIQVSNGYAKYAREPRIQEGCISSLINSLKNLP